MPGLRKSLAALGALRSKFEGLLAAARRRSPGGAKAISLKAPLACTNLWDLAPIPATCACWPMLLSTCRARPHWWSLCMAAARAPQNTTTAPAGRRWPIGSASSSSIPSSVKPTIQKRASHGSCPATSHVTKARRSRSNRWSSTRSQNSASTAAGCSLLVSLPAAPWHP